MAIHDEDLLLISDSQDGNESKKIKYSTLKSNINGDSGNDLQAVTDNGNTTTNFVRSDTGFGSYRTPGTTFVGGSDAYAVGIAPTGSAGNSAWIAYDGSASFGLGNILLNADGSAKFAGRVDVGPYLTGSGCALQTYGEVVARNDNSTVSSVFSGYKGGLEASQVTSRINNDGSASFGSQNSGTFFNVSGDLGAGNSAVIENTNVNGYGVRFSGGGASATEYVADFRKQDGTSVLKLNGDESATFAGSVAVGDFDSASNPTDDGALFNANGAIQISRSANDRLAFSVNAPAGRTIEFESDGSAEFKGVGTFNLEASRASSLRIQENGTTNTYFRNDGVAVFSDILSIGEDLQDPSPGCSIELNSDGSASFGSGNISLNASGSASFAGTVFSETGLRASGANSSIKVRQDGDGEVAFAVAQGSTLTEDSTIKFNGNGSASFEGTVDISSKALTEEGIRLKDSGRLQIRRDGSPSPNRVLEVYKDGNATSNITASIGNDGSATFAGNVNVGDDDTYVNLNSDYGILSIRNDTQLPTSDPNQARAQAFRVYSGGVGQGFLTSQIRTDGSATFAGVVTTDDRFVCNAAGNKKNGDVAFLMYQQDGATDAVSITAGGSATFAGDIDADNVFFSATDGTKHNIRERIEEAITRLTAIETADISDDQEHSALLTLIANMSSRITALEAQLAGGN